MTSRGSRRPEELRRQITPPDPTLATRPVPETRYYDFRSLGPAANSDLRRTARPMRELVQAADPTTFHDGMGVDYLANMDPVRRLLEAVEKWRFQENDSSWGFYVFVTAYSDPARNRLPQAMVNWVKIVQHTLSLYTLPIYSEEAFRRFKFNLVEDRGALEGASADRVRAEFRAQIKGLRLCDNPNNPDNSDDSGFMPPARNQACFILDEAAIAMLADAILPEDEMEYLATFEFKTATVVDGFWDRSRQDPLETYRGVGQLSVISLPSFYATLTRHANLDAMGDLHPINGFP